jgi:hypothetical protein
MTAPRRSLGPLPTNPASLREFRRTDLPILGRHDDDRVYQGTAGEGAAVDADGNVYAAELPNSLAQAGGAFTKYSDGRKRNPCAVQRRRVFTGFPLLGAQDVGGIYDLAAAAALKCDAHAVRFRLDRITSRSSSTARPRCARTVESSAASKTHAKPRSPNPTCADSTIRMTTLALLFGSLAFSSGEAIAQQKHRVTHTTLPDNIKITQQLVIDVGDVPGHQVRAFEHHRTYPDDAPVINGLRLVESWHRGVTDYTDRNGPGTVYVAYVLESSQNIGAGNVTAVAGPITGGTGKFLGITGITRLLTHLCRIRT